MVQAHFVMNNIFEGMIWFFLPAALVITNDIFAYVCGITFGRTQLIALSPKKTVEGFVGAWVFTIVFGIALTNIMTRYSYFTCPVNVRPPALIKPRCDTDIVCCRILERTFSLACSVSRILCSFLGRTRFQSGIKSIHSIFSRCSSMPWS